MLLISAQVRLMNRAQTLASDKEGDDDFCGQSSPSLSRQNSQTALVLSPYNTPVLLFVSGMGANTYQVSLLTFTSIILIQVSGVFLNA